MAGQSGFKNIVHGPTKSKAFVVPWNLDGTRLDKVIAACVPQMSRTAARKLIASGAAFLDGRRVCIASRKVRAGSRIAFGKPLDKKSLDFDVVFEDDSVIVVDKPAGIAVQPTRSVSSECLLEAVREHRKKTRSSSYVGLLHRIDRDTSGLVLFTTDKRANKVMARAFAEHAMGRSYDAIVLGEIDSESGVIDAPITRADSRGRRKVSSSGKPALTRYTVKERFEGATWLELELQTGRTHQIRVHLAHLGHPVVGDRLYGRHVPPQGRHAAALGAFPRQALHASRLSFTHPFTGAEITLSSDLPEDMSELTRLLGSTGKIRSK